MSALGLHEAKEDRPDLYPMKIYNHGRFSIPSKLVRKYKIQDGDTVIFVDRGNGELSIYLKEQYLKGVQT